VEPPPLVLRGGGARTIVNFIRLFGGTSASLRRPRRRWQRSSSGVPAKTPVTKPGAYAETQGKTKGHAPRLSRTSHHSIPSRMQRAFVLYSWTVSPPGKRSHSASIINGTSIDEAVEPKPNASPAAYHYADLQEPASEPRIAQHPFTGQRPPRELAGRWATPRAFKSLRPSELLTSLGSLRRCRGYDPSRKLRRPTAARQCRSRSPLGGPCAPSGASPKPWARRTARARSARR